MVTRSELHVHWDNRLGMIAYVGEREITVTRNMMDIIKVSAKRGGIYAR